MREQIQIEVAQLITLWQREAILRLRERIAQQQKGEAFR